jgi:zinc protease
MTLDRKTPPMPQAMEKFSLAKANSHSLSNGTGVHFINLGEQKIVRIEFIINAGTWNELEKGQSYFALKMLNEGTSKLNATAIAEFIANYGAFLEFNHGADRINITLYALEKHLKTLIALVADLIQDSQYKEQDFVNLKNITNQGLKVNLEKTSFVASRLFREKLFGAHHPYGSNFEVEEVAQLSLDSVKNFHQKFIKSLHNLQIFVAGSFDQDLILKLLNDNFGQHKTVITTNNSNVKNGSLVKNFSIEKEGALQTSIRLGTQIINRSHPDYQKFLVTNEILGGFFGSRLMKNIREDKGFTYGIGASVNVFEHEAYMVIGTDVKKEVANQTFEEIEKEIKMLQTTLVDEEELAIVKNYILGSFMGSINTPFSLIDKYKTLHYSNLNYDYYDRYYETISQISAETVREIAQQYLNYDEMVKISVG